MASAAIADVSVIICAYSDERWPQLAAAVASLETQTIAPREVLLVVDHNDALAARARTAFPALCVVPNPGRRGVSDARNTGLRLARGEIFAFLDDDAAAAPDWIERLVAAFEAPGVLGVGGTVDPDWAEGRPAWFPEEFDWVVGCSYRGLPARSAPVRNPIGANMAFRREAIEAVDWFQVGLGRVGTRALGCEETEFCLRLRRRRPDAVVLHDPGIRVRHHVPGARGTWRYFVRRCWAEGQSKADLSRVAGADGALAAERSYVRRTLPLGVLRALKDGAVTADPNSLLRAGAIPLGLGVTAAGYGTKVIQTKLRRQPILVRGAAFE